MKTSNDLIEEFGADKITHGLTRVLILAVCIVASAFLLGVSFLGILDDMILETVMVYLAGKWRESKGDVPDTADIRATIRGVYLAVSIILLI